MLTNPLGNLPKWAWLINRNFLHWFKVLCIAGLLYHTWTFNILRTIRLLNSPSLEDHSLLFTANAPQLLFALCFPPLPWPENSPKFLHSWIIIMQWVWREEVFGKFLWHLCRLTWSKFYGTHVVGTKVRFLTVEFKDLIMTIDLDLHMKREKLACNQFLVKWILKVVKCIV